MRQARRGIGDGGWYAEGADDAWQTPSAGTTPWVGDYANFADADDDRARLPLPLPDARRRASRAVLRRRLQQRRVLEGAQSRARHRERQGGVRRDGRRRRESAAVPDGVRRRRRRRRAASCLPPAAAVGAAPVGTCACADGFAGDACEGTLATTTVAKSDAEGVSGTLAPGPGRTCGSRLTPTPPPPASWSRSATRAAPRAAAEPRRDPRPAERALRAEHVGAPRAPRAVQDQLPRPLPREAYFVAVHNMNYYADSACEYVVAIESSLANEYAMTSPGFMTVISRGDHGRVRVHGRALGVPQHSSRAPCGGAARPAAFCSAAGTRTGGTWPWPATRAGGARRAGARAPSSTRFRAWCSGARSGTAGSGAWRTSRARCASTPSSAARRCCASPECQHAFHKDCIEGWLAQNTTCPNVPREPGVRCGGTRTSRQRARGRGGAAPASPPGVVEGAPTSSDFDRIADEAREARRGRARRRAPLEASRAAGDAHARPGATIVDVTWTRARDANFVTSVPDVHTTLLSITHTCGYVAPFSGSYGGVSAFRAALASSEGMEATRRRRRAQGAVLGARRPASLPSPGAP